MSEDPEFWRAVPEAALRWSAEGSVSRINDVAMTFMGRMGLTTVTLRPDISTLLGCRFEERAGHGLTAFRSLCLSVSGVVPAWFVRSSLQILTSLRV